VFLLADDAGYKSYATILETTTKLIETNPDLVQRMVDGDAQTLGIGAMTDARWQAFFESAVAAGLYPKGLDYKKAYTLRFVDKRYGIEGR
jgi:hypothetical protein